jgi:hypothetical protein
MANRSFNRLQALDKEVKQIYARVTIGASGAPTLVAADSVGVASISRVSAGLYTITLQDTYNKLVYGNCEVRTPSAEDIKANLVTESVSSAKTVQFRCVAVATATDPASGDSLYVVLHLKNSSV